MPSGNRLRPVASGPTVGPRLVPAGALPWAAPDQTRHTRLEFVPIDRLPVSATSPGATGGMMEATFQVPADRVWRIERVAVSSTSAAVTTAVVYLGGADPANMVDQTPAGNGDIADETNPIVAPANSVVRVRWTGATNGAVGTVRLEGWAGALTQVPVG